MIQLRICILIIGLGASHLLAAQADSLLLTKNFSFADGIYLTFEAFQNNKPSYSWEEVQANLVTNPQTFMAQAEYIRVKESKGSFNLSEIWGISLGGLPYIRLDKEHTKKSLTTFAALKVRGKICYFEYEDYEEVAVPMNAYNPLTGKPFIESSVQRKVEIVHQRILDFNTGTILPLTPANLKAWISDDYQLINAIESLGDEAGDKLFKCILIYDDRHQIYLPNND